MGLPWRLMEINGLEMCTVGGLIVLILCAGAFVDPTVKEHAFETTILVGLVILVSVVGCAFIRVGACLVKGGRTGLYPSYPKPINVNTMQACLVSLQDLQFSDETLHTVMSTF